MKTGARNRNTQRFIGALCAATFVFTASCGDEAKYIPVSEVTLCENGEPLSEKTLTLTSGEAAPSADLTAIVAPVDASNKAVSWSASEEGVVALSDTQGAAITITALKVGVATVTVTTQDGQKTASCVITVVEAGAEQPDDQPDDTPLVRLIKFNAPDAVYDGTGAVTGFGSGEKYLIWGQKINPASDTVAIQARVKFAATSGHNGVGFISVNGSTRGGYSLLTAQNIKNTGAGSLGGSSFSPGITWETGADAQSYVLKAEITGGNFVFTVYDSDGTTELGVKGGFSAAAGYPETAAIYAAIGGTQVQQGTWSDIKVTYNGTEYGINALEPQSALPILTVSPTEKSVVKGGQESVAYTATASGGAPAAVDAVSSDESVVRVDGAADGTITFTGLAAGAAVITVTSSAAPSLIARINVTVTDFPASDNYGDLSARAHPGPGAVNVYEDEELSIAFDAEPSFGAGQIYIYDASNDSIADAIKLTGETNTYGQRLNLNVADQLVRKEGNKVVIIPHSGALAAGKEYYVAIPNDVIKGALNSQTFTGFSPASKSWKFTVRPAHTTSGATITVGKSGASDFRTVQAALNAAASGSGAVAIEIDAGMYRENLDWRSSRPLTIKGKDGEANADVVIAFENCDALNPGTSGRPLFLINQNAAAVTIQNLTIENTRVKMNSGDQAETVYFNSTGGTLIAKNARFVSRQDTLQLKGFCWFFECYIAGDVDFIWGANDLALFESCEINARTDNRNPSNPAYVLQARTLANKKGFVFVDCNFTADENRTGTVYMARTNGAGSDSSTDGWDSVAIIKSRVDTAKYAGAFWNKDGKTIYPSAGAVNCGLREYGNTDSTGAPLNTSERDGANYVMSHEEFSANYSTRQMIAAGTPLSSLVGNESYTP
ncbi:MAG: Ig-like domain-containing protein [Treponema sp.]|jgi:pectin methylesterase-like acyl-CoA thioesterase|nr:Ig-like domain-containing protein [Treponema sp.]